MAHTLKAPNKLMVIFFLATIIGNIFEIFDFFIFIFLSPIIAELFFPKYIGVLSIMFTYGTITISYLVRPLGAIILGSLGDKYGRKSIFSLTILMTAIPSLIIGLAPTYNQAGIFAIVILLLSRIFQGFSSGAEMPGAVTFIAETYHSKAYYFYVAWIPFGANLSIAIGSWFIREMVKTMSKSALYSYGWRIPFLCGSLLAVIGFYIRKNLAESQEFKFALQKNYIVHSPTLTLFSQHKAKVIIGIILVTLSSLLTAVFHVFLPNLFVNFFHLSLTTGASISAVGALTVAISIILFSIFATKIKPTLIIRYSIVGIMILLISLLLEDIPFYKTTNIYAIVITLSVLVGGINGVYWGILIDLFPVEVRYSGVATCFSIASLIGAGITPLWTSSLLLSTHTYKSIIWVCLAVTIVSFANSIALDKLLKTSPAQHPY